MKSNLRTSALFLLFSSPLLADVTVFEEIGPGTGNVVVHDELGISPPVRPAELQGIQLVALDFVGRTNLDRLRPDKPRLGEDIPGAARIQLPLGQGSLYRYRRDPGGSAVFGFFVVGADGAARSLWERPGTGAGAQTDPIATRVGVDPVGGAFLVGTTLAAGGDLIEVTLDGSAIDRTPTLGPLPFQIGGVTLLSDWGVGVTSNAILRFEREDGAAASAVSFPGGPAGHPTFFEGSLVASANGNRVAFVAGDAPGSAHVWVAAPAGAARRVTTNPGPLSGAGFLPEHPAGPTLALSPDGAMCAWREEGVSHESFVKLVQAPNQVGLQITADERFTDTLDDTGVLAFIGLSTLILVVGEQDQAGSGEIEGGDFYQAELGGHARSTGGGGSTAALSNLSGTSGDLQVPFLSQGELDTDTGFLRIPGTTAILVPLEGSSGTGSLHRFDWALQSFDTLLTDVREVQLVQSAGSHLLLGMRRNFADDRRDLVSLAGAPGSVPVILASLPDDTEFGRCASRADGTVALVAEVGVDEFSGRVHLPSGAGALLSNQPRTYGPAQGFAPDGSMVTTIVLPGGSSLFVVWRPAGAKALLTQPVTGYLLPGA